MTQGCSKKRSVIESMDPYGHEESDELFKTIGESIGEGSETNSEGSGDTGASTSSATQRHVLEMSDASKRLKGQFRDNITNAMWDDYVACGNGNFGSHGLEGQELLSATIRPDIPLPAARAEH
ncbi:hypothetical protein SO802_015041 [Lithocarpus litseifolius]|uniref:Uncharacterized protein n=1 Tax=Lithocarpus litseifolius TaxID=425828 RepID=A0AAW2CSL5_9ROSI